MPSILYHYTNAAALSEILRSGVLNPSLCHRRPRDARYGDGQYLTDIPPGTLALDDLSNAIVGSAAEAIRFTHYLALDVTGLQVTRGRNVFVVRGRTELDVAGRIIHAGVNNDDVSQNRVGS